MSASSPPDQAMILRRLLLGRTGGEAPAEIAVVANAPVPPSGERAARIDAAALVVRMTTFALDTGTPSIGTRTHVVVLHRALKPGPDTFADHDRRLYLLAEPGRMFWEQPDLPPWWPADLELVPVSNREFTSRTRSALRLGRVDIAWPTTGTLTVHLMHRLFPHARILLAGTSLPGRRDTAGRLAHQWGPAVAVTPEHRLRREGRLIERWQRTGWLEVLA